MGKLKTILIIKTIELRLASNGASYAKACKVELISSLGAFEYKFALPYNRIQTREQQKKAILNSVVHYFS